jgi:predicted phosphodiesterase
VRYIRKQFSSCKRTAVCRIYPLGDVHIGAASCDETLLKEWVATVSADPDAVVICMGDLIDAIGPRDPRWNVDGLASWLSVQDMVDICGAQKDRLFKFISPICKKIIAVVEGNHERQIKRHYERDVYSEIVQGIRERGGHAQDVKLQLGYYGWMHLVFSRKAPKKDTKGSSRMVTLNIHHGYVGGRLAGGKALALQRWLYTHNCDISLMGHSHNLGVQIEAVERISKTGKLLMQKRLGCFTGTFMSGTGEGESYSEVKGYLPMPASSLMLEIAPLKYDDGPRITAHAAI